MCPSWSLTKWPLCARRIHWGEDGIEKNPSDKCTCGFFLRLFSCLKDFSLFRGRRDNNCLRFEPTSHETRRILQAIRTRVHRAPHLSSTSLFVLFVFFIANKFFLICTPRNQTTMDLVYVKGPKTRLICTHTIPTS